MQFSELALQSLFCGLAAALFVNQANSAVLEQCPSNIFCDVGGTASASFCYANEAQACIQVLKDSFPFQPNGKLAVTANGVTVGGCYCSVECKAGPYYPACMVDPPRVFELMNGLIDECIVAQNALGLTVGEWAIWSFSPAPKPQVLDA